MESPLPRGDISHQRGDIPRGKIAPAGDRSQRIVPGLVSVRARPVLPADDGNCGRYVRKYGTIHFWTHCPFRRDNTNLPRFARTSRHRRRHRLSSAAKAQRMQYRYASYFKQRDEGHELYQSSGTHLTLFRTPSSNFLGSGVFPCHNDLHQVFDERTAHPSCAREYQANLKITSTEPLIL